MQRRTYAVCRGTGVNRRVNGMPIDPKLQLDEYSLVTTRLMKKHAAISEETADSDELRASTAQLALILDLAHQAFARHKPAALTVDRLAGRLHKLRRQVAPAVWQKLVPLAQQHRVAEYLIQDPFTRWSVEKPRGYSGDAGLLDIYYKHAAADEIVAS